MENNIRVNPGSKKPGLLGASDCWTYALPPGPVATSDLLAPQLLVASVELHDSGALHLPPV